MAARKSHGVADAQIARGIAIQNTALRQQGTELGGPDGQLLTQPKLSDEQVAAVQRVTEVSAIAAVVGYAGAGKSTMLAAARMALEGAGYRVVGSALAGNAADGLQTASGIPARTLVSWEASWTVGKDKFGPKDVLIIDEAGMIGSRQMARVVDATHVAGVKLVLAGDHEQLQAIGAGAPFRAIVEQIGVATLQDVRRQKHDWQRQASVAFARHETADALHQYDAKGAIRHWLNRDMALDGLVRDYIDDATKQPDALRVALAHRRARHQLAHSRRGQSRRANERRERRRRDGRNAGWRALVWRRR
jgi:ATP-dependent exoDNAse (exonuclease V) alpha subunit